MRPQTKDVSITSNIQGETIKMGIDTSSLVHIMDVLSNLYKDPELAVIRELSTNALDATIEAGSTKPIEVTLPNRLANTFVVKDYGVGMSLEDIRNVYSKYGNSTRRESDDFVGSLGLGSKSPFTLTSQFTVTSVKNGRKIMVSVSRDSTGVGSMQVVSDEPTASANGTTIVVPYSGYHGDMKEKALNFYKYWDTGTVILDGKPNVSSKDNVWLKFNDHIYLSSPDRYNSRQSCIVMGNVPYPVEINGEDGIVYFAPMGAVDFAPSREALYMSPRTIAYIDQVKSEVRGAYQKAMNEHLSSATSHAEAITKFSASEFRNKTKCIYNGVSFDDHTREMASFAFSASSRYNGSNEEVHSIYGYYAHSGTPVIITDYKNEHFTSDQRRKIRLYFASIDKDYETHFLVKDDVQSVWLDSVDRHSWLKIKKFKVTPLTPKTPKVKKVAAVDMFRDPVTGKDEAYDSTKTLLFGTANAYTLTRDFARNSEFLANTQYKCAHNGPNFLKKYPNAVRYTEYLKTQADNYIDNATDDLINMYRASRVNNDDMFVPYIAGVIDPKIAAYSKNLNIKRTAAENKAIDTMGTAVSLSNRPRVATIIKYGYNDGPLRRYLAAYYPLIDSLHLYSIKNPLDVAAYINDRYNSTIKNITTTTIKGI